MYIYSLLPVNYQHEMAKSYHKVFMKRIATLETLLYDKSCSSTRLTVSPHAVERYIQRIHKTATPDEARKILYTRVLQEAQVFDKVPDGKYSVSKNVIAIVENQAVVTCYKRT